MGLWTTSPSGRCACPWQEFGTGWFWKSLPTQTHGFMIYRISAFEEKSLNPQTSQQDFSILPFTLQVFKGQKWFKGQPRFALAGAECVRWHNVRCEMKSEIPAKSAVTVGQQVKIRILGEFPHVFLSCIIPHWDSIQGWCVKDLVKSFAWVGRRWCLSLSKHRGPWSHSYFIIWEQYSCNLRPAAVLLWVLDPKENGR